MKLRIKQVKEDKIEKVDVLSAKLFKLKNKLSPAFYDRVRAFINKGDLAKAEEFLNRVSSIGGGTYIDATKEAATFTDKHDDNPKLKGGQKDLPDEVQAKIVAKEGEDHEVSMAQASLKAIISSASQLMVKLGNDERNIPGWIQDHITNAENYIEQANQGFHELDNEYEEN
mgnify:CR=1 FL=1